MYVGARTHLFERGILKAHRMQRLFIQVLACSFNLSFERESFMPTSTVSTSSFGLMLRPAIAAAALMACSLAAQAADPLAPVVAPINSAVTGAKTIANGKVTTNGQVNAAADANVDGNANANAAIDAKSDMSASSNGKAISDGWITTKVKSEIVANSATKGLKVHVTTKGGIVALKGKLPSQEAVDTVKSLAVNVKGVQSVDTSALVVAGS